MRSLLCLLLFLGAAAPLAALSPTRSQHSWVAGTGETGNADGAFMVASFKRPMGLLHDGDTDRLFVADSGNGALRVVALAQKNATSTLKLTLSGTVKAFGFVEPSLLAWKVPGKQLYCLDKKKPGVAVVDLEALSGRWLPLPASFTAKTGEALTLDDAVALRSLPGQYAVLSLGGQGRLLFFDLPGDAAVVASLGGLPGPLEDLAVEPDGLWGLSRESRSVFKLYPSGAVPEWALGFVAAVTSTATCPDLLADTVAGRSLGAPYSFVPGSPGLKVACDAPALMAYREPGGDFSTWYLLDQHGRRLGTENDNIYDEQRQVLHTRTQYFLTVGPKRLFAQPVHLVEDAGDERWYLSETESHRIVSFTRSRPDDASAEVGWDGYHDVAFPPKKKAGVHRIAVFSTCYFKESKDTMRKADTFTKRFGWYLNLLSSHRDGQAYEPIYYGTSVPPESSLMMLIQGLGPKAVVKYQSDELLVAMRPRDLSTIVRGYLTYPIGEDGLPIPVFDPEYNMTKRSWADVAKAPLFVDLAKYVVANESKIHTLKVMAPPVLYVLDDEVHWPGGVKFDYLNPDLQAKLFALYTAEFRALKKRFSDLAAAEGRKLKLTIALFPEHGTIGPQELYDGDPSTGSLALIRRHFREMCKSLGIRYIDVVDEMRVHALETPFLEVMDGHTTLAGNELMGLVAAQSYLDHE